MFPAEVERLQEQEDGNADKSHQKQNDLDCSLTRVQRRIRVFKGTGLQEHVDQHVQQGRRILTPGRPVNAPLVDDRERQVAEDGLEEDHARHKVAPNVDRSLEVACVDKRPHQRKGHVAPTKQDTELHLVTVGEQQIVLRIVPAPIQTEGICVTRNTVRSRTLAVVVPDPHRLGQGKTEGEGIGVDQTSVDGEDTHHEDDVTTVKHHGK